MCRCSDMQICRLMSQCINVWIGEYFRHLHPAYCGTYSHICISAVCLLSKISIMIKISSDALAERFMKYVQIDTQSDPQSNTFPTTEKQKDLGRLLLQELQAMGVTSEMDKYGYVYA